MARVLGALLSEQAWGKFGRILVFRRGNSFDTVRVQTPYKDKDSNPQSVIRKTYGLIQEDWRVSNDAIREEYILKAKGKNITGHNAFYKEFFRWIHKGVCGDGHCGITTCRKS